MSKFTNAIEAIGATVLANKLEITVQRLYNWIERGVPIDQCTRMEIATDGAVTRRDLRPDDWGVIWPELIDADHPWPAKTAIKNVANAGEVA